MNPVLEPEETLSPEQVGVLAAEVMHPEVTPTEVNLCGRYIPIKFMAIKKERQVIRLLTPLLPFFDRGGNPTSPENLAVLMESGMDILPQVVAIIAGDAVPLDWIEENCSAGDLIAVVTAQLQKYKQQDALGKLSRLFGR